MPFFSAVMKRRGAFLAEQSGHGVLVGLACVGFLVHDHRLAGSPNFVGALRRMRNE
jgi:hypothetical protein